MSGLNIYLVKKKILKFNLAIFFRQYKDKEEEHQSGFFSALTNMVSSTCAFSLPVEKYKKPSGVGIFKLSLDIFEIMIAGTARPIFCYIERLCLKQSKNNKRIDLAVLTTW